MIFYPITEKQTKETGRNKSDYSFEPQINDGPVDFLIFLPKEWYQTIPIKNNNCQNCSELNKDIEGVGKIGVGKSDKLVGKDQMAS